MEDTVDSNGEENPQVFSQVRVLLNAEILHQFNDSNIDVAKFLQAYSNTQEKAIKIKHDGNSFVVYGTLKQIVQLEHHIMAELHTKIDMDVLTTGLPHEIQDFFQELFSQGGKRSKQDPLNTVIVNKTYKLIPYCYMWATSWAKLNSFLADIKICLKNCTFENITVSYKSSDQEMLTKFIRLVDAIYSGKVSIVKEKLEGTDEYLSQILTQIHKKFKPEFAIILQKSQLFIELQETQYEEFNSFMKTVTGNETKTVVKSKVNAQLYNGASNNSSEIFTDDEDYGDGESGKNSPRAKSDHSDNNAGFERQVSKDPIQTEIDVDGMTMNFIQLFYQDELHEVAAKYNVMIDDTDGIYGKIKVMTFQGNTVPDIAIKDIQEFVQNVNFSLKTEIINLRQFQDRLKDKWRDVMDCGKEHKAKIILPTKEGDDEIFVTAKEDILESVVGIIKQILGMGPIQKTRDRHLAENATSSHSQIPKTGADHVKPPRNRVLAADSSYNSSFGSEIEMKDETNHQQRPKERIMVPESQSDYIPRDEKSMTGDASSKSVLPFVASPMSFRHVSSGVLVEVIVGDITKLKVGAVVNAANEDLKHYGGVAMAIRKAGGRDIDEESKRYIRIHGRLAIAATCVTTAGKMPAKKVIHTVGPQWSHYMAEKCLKQLNDTFTNVLHAADKEKLKSVAIPAISAGIYGVPPTIVADTAITSITEYLGSNPASSVKRIVLVDIDDEMVLLFQGELGKKVNGGVYTVESPSQGATGYTAPPTSGANGGQGAKPKTTSVHHMSARGASRGSGAGSKQDMSSIRSTKTKQDLAKSSTTHQKDTKSQQTPKTSKQEEEEEDNCCICMCPPTNPKTLKCKHTFCTECIDRGFKIKPACPVCGTIYGEITGDQPRNGKMDVKKERGIRLPGCTGSGAIVIEYYFPDGTQSAEHPNPGKPYSGTHRTAYLPDNTEGNKVLKLLRKAFNARLVFTVGSSRTTGKSGTVTWNDIHHKTNQNGGPQRFGYPDDTYLSRVQEELAAKGIK